jgi:hypothetical protein
MTSKELLLPLLFFAVFHSPGQETVRTPAFSFGKPALAVRGEFLGDEGTAILNANSGGTLTVAVTNTGLAAAHGAVLIITPDGLLKDVRIVQVDTIGDIQAGETRTEKVALMAPPDARSQQGALTLTVKADPGPVSAESKVDITLLEIPAPRLDVSLIGENPTIPAGGVLNLTARVRNTGSGEARGVSATFLPAGPGTEPGLAEMGKTVPLGLIAQGAAKEVPLTVRPPGSSKGIAAFVVRLDEQRAKFSVFETLSFLVKGAMPAEEESGFAAFRKGEYIQAIAIFEKMVAARKASKEVYFNLGLSYFKSRDRARCLPNMQRSAALGSTEAKNWIRANTISVDVVTVTYRQAVTDPFSGYTPPVGLGVLPFTDSLNHDTPLTGKMYDALRAKNESLRIFPYSTITSEQATRGLNTLSPSSPKMLDALEKVLSINFVITGEAHDSPGSAFRMDVIRCSDGGTIISHEFKTSTTSTAIDDAVMLILKGRSPVYKMSHSLTLP